MSASIYLYTHTHARARARARAGTYQTYTYVSCRSECPHVAMGPRHAAVRVNPNKNRQAMLASTRTHRHRPRRVKARKRKQGMPSHCAHAGFHARVHAHRLCPTGRLPRVPLEYHLSTV